MTAIVAGIDPIHPIDRNGLLRTTERSNAPIGLKQPDIAYLPDREKWQSRSARRLVQHPTLPATPLKEGFPVKYISPLAWEGKDWTHESQWVHNLSAEQLKEIDDAVQHFHGLNLELGQVSPATFPLPTLGPILKDLAMDLFSGRGFFVLRTIPVDSYSRYDNVLIYAGVSSYIGDRGLQDRNGGVLSHIIDLTKTKFAKEIGGPAYTTTPQVFHTDLGAEVVSLFALGIAAEGGTSRISSIGRVYNELAETRPDLIRTLAEPWAFEDFNREPPYIERPVLYYHDSKIIIQYARRYFTGYGGLQRSTNIPPITEAQAEALDTLHFLGEKFSLGLNFQKGDIQYINNLGIFHCRDGFKDDETHKRHLLRLWLINKELGWKKPDPLKPLVNRVFDVRPEEQTFALEPMVRTDARAKQ